jgi:hypothetical protein
MRRKYGGWPLNSAVSIQSGRAHINRRDAKSAEKREKERVLIPIIFQ